MAGQRVKSKIKELTSLLFAAVVLLASGAAQAVPLPLMDYVLDVEITEGNHFGLNPGDIILDAGTLRLDLTGLTGVGSEQVDVVDFSMTLGTETWSFESSGTVSGLIGYGSYATLNVATFTDGTLTRVELASGSQNNHLLELGSLRTADLGDLSLFADNYFEGEVSGRYAATAIPEPSSALVFGLGSLIAVARVRRH